METSGNSINTVAGCDCNARNEAWGSSCNNVYNYSISNTRKADQNGTIEELLVFCCPRSRPSPTNQPCNISSFFELDNAVNAPMRVKI